MIAEGLAYTAAGATGLTLGRIGYRAWLRYLLRRLAERALTEGWRADRERARRERERETTARFQREHGLDVDGLTGPNTFAVLHERIEHYEKEVARQQDKIDRLRGSLKKAQHYERQVCPECRGTGRARPVARTLGSDDPVYIYDPAPCPYCDGSRYLSDFRQYTRSELLWIAKKQGVNVAPAMTKAAIIETLERARRYA